MNVIEKLKNMDENTRIVYRNTFASFGVKGISLFIALFTTPAYIRYFNDNEVLGVWFTILSVLAWILNCDMGIGNGLRNNLVYAIAEKDDAKAKKYISSAYIFLVAVGMAILFIFVIVSRFAKWNRIFNISEVAFPAEMLNRAMIVLIVAILLQFVLRLITSILYALQKAFIPGLLNFATNLLMLYGVTFFNTHALNNNFVQLAILYLFAVNVPLLAATAWIFLTSMRNATPSLTDFRWEYAKSVLKVGGMFLWLQLMAMVLDNTNSYLISLFINNSAVVEYQIYYKVFSLATTVIMLLSSSVWSTVTKAKAEQNWGWLRKAYDKFMLLGMVAGVGEFILIIPLQWFFNLWLQGDTIQVNYGIAIIFALSGFFMLWRTIVATFANGLCELKLQAIMLTIGAIVNIPLAWFFVQLMQSYTAIIIANIVSMAPYCITQSIWCVKYLKNKCKAVKS